MIKYLKFHYFEIAIMNTQNTYLCNNSNIVSCSKSDAVARAPISCSDSREVNFADSLKNNEN